MDTLRGPKRRLKKARDQGRRPRRCKRGWRIRLEESERAWRTLKDLKVQKTVKIA